MITLDVRAGPTRVSHRAVPVARDFDGTLSPHVKEESLVVQLPRAHGPAPHLALSWRHSTKQSLSQKRGYVWTLRVFIARSVSTGGRHGTRASAASLSPTMMQSERRLDVLHQAGAVVLILVGIPSG